MGSVYADSIGDIVESTGVGDIVRNNETLPIDVGSDIVLYDEARTGNGRMLIEFLDKEELALTEHTQVYIDEVYYDPNPSLSKMSIRMVQGTARFASGNGAKIKKANINIPPNKENPTTESLKLLRIIVKSLLVELALKVFHF